DNLRSFTPLQRIALLNRAHNKCESCGKKITSDNFEADHIKPWSKGGLTSLNNAQALCVNCNRKKSSNSEG
ncbi:MAG TPA: HNH endonuclease signature motif containing protein, partial [Alphaproteobacteria bacterium]|nr:HNH endonuclease signature motif containing protein [Alphaproteobacteria bacterium]